MLIEERWNSLPVEERVAIAEAAGIDGRVGSTDWDKMHEMDKEALIKWARPRETKVQDQVWKDAGVKARHGKFIAEEPGQIDVNSLAPAQDYLLWVGYGSYPTIYQFIEEANRVGVSRRISRLPNGLELGTSEVFLAHDEGETGDAVIFGYFVPDAVEVIVHRNENGIPKELENIATAVTVERALTEEERGCGFREDIGAIYLMGKKLIILDPHKDYNAIIDQKGQRFRGIKKIDSQKILSGKTKSAPSERHKVKRSERILRKKGDSWTDDEKEKLKELVAKYGVWRGIREMCKVNGRTVNSASYQWGKIKKEEQDED